jgi:hypothetical protein
LGSGVVDVAPSIAILTGTADEFVVMKKLEPLTEQALEKRSLLLMLV